MKNNRLEQQFRRKIDELIVEYDGLTGMEIYEIFKDLADGTLTHVYDLRSKNKKQKEKYEK